MLSFLKQKSDSMKTMKLHRLHCSRLILDFASSVSGERSEAQSSNLNITHEG